MAKQALPLTRGGAKPPRRNNRPLDVEYIQVSGLQSDPRPQRKHSQRQLDNLAGAIARFDIVRPLLVTEDNVVLDGNAVLEVLRREGRDTVPVIRISGYSSAELRSLQMALNRIGDHADWDLDVLRADFLMLQADPEFDFSLDFTGFDQVFVDRVTLAGDVGSQQDEVPEHGEEAPVTRVGDTWCCGRHRIICGDSRDGAIFIMLLDQDRVRLTLTDPPYNVRISGNVSGLGKVRHGEFAMASGEMNRAEFVEFQRQVFDHCKRFSVDGALLYAFIDGRHVADQIAAGETVFGELKQLVVWAKDNAGMGTFYRSQHELLTIWKVGDVPLSFHPAATRVLGLVTPRSVG